VAWIGDSNNMCNTWLQAAEVLDFKRPRLQPRPAIVEPERAGLFGTDHYEAFVDPMDACRGRPVIPPTSGPAWARSGKRRAHEAFADWQVDSDMMRMAPLRPVHCTAFRASRQEVESAHRWPQSVVWDERKIGFTPKRPLLEHLLLGRVEE